MYINEDEKIIIDMETEWEYLMEQFGDCEGEQEVPEDF